MPRVRVYQTQTRKLIVYRSWKGTPSGEARGATYRVYPDYDALISDPLALDTMWIEGTKEVNDAAHFEKGLRRELMKALGKSVVVRLD